MLNEKQINEIRVIPLTLDDLENLVTIHPIKLNKLCDLALDAIRYKEALVKITEVRYESNSDNLARQALENKHGE